MFERLSDGFSNAFKKISGRSKLTEANIRDAMDDVRTALLEADVSYETANAFCDDVVDLAIGRQVLTSLKPGEQMIGIVNDALVDLMKQGTDDTPGIVRVSPAPTVVMMCGLQGSGKTTTCGKLAAYLKKRGRSVMIAAADLQRPAAVDQLETVAHQVRDEMPGGAQVHFYAERDKIAEYGQAAGAAVKLCKNAYKAAKDAHADTLILDTAGRLHINDELMNELVAVNDAVKAHQILLVVDAMTGQDAVRSAKAFDERLPIDGVILTKFDSDTRGGAALTVKQVTGKPTKFIGTGEKLDALEEFHPERIASRILGMGDVVSLVEKAQEEVSEDEAEELAKKMAKGEMNLDDFLKQLKTIRRMGPLKQVMGMLPGLGSMVKDANIDDKQLDHTEAIIRSMTPTERKDSRLINPSRRKRIAHGAGKRADDVSRLTKQFELMSKMSKQMAGLSMKQRAASMKQLQASAEAGDMSALEGLPQIPGLTSRRGSTRTQSPKKGFKKRKPTKGGKKRR